MLIDGREVAEGSAQVSVFDWGVQRGFGCFEVIGSYEGRPFRLGPHLERLNRSAAALRIDLAPLEDIADWVRAVAASGGDCQVRVLVTGGGRDELFDTPSRTVVLWEPKPHVPDLLRLLPTVATWHPATDRGFAGVKWLSYAPNMASTDAARRAGFDDALLLSTDALVLEGPTFTVAWISEGMLETPTVGLGILASITRDVLFEAAGRLETPVHQGRYPLERLIGADEVVALSTVKEITPVAAVGEHAIAPGPIAAKLGAVFGDIVREELAGGPLDRR